MARIAQIPRPPRPRPGETKPPAAPPAPPSPPAAPAPSARAAPAYRARGPTRAPASSSGPSPQGYTIRPTAQTLRARNRRCSVTFFMSDLSRVGVVHRERAGPGRTASARFGARRHRERGRDRHRSRHRRMPSETDGADSADAVIGVAWRRGAWQRATRTAPGGAAVPVGIVLS